MDRETFAVLVAVDVALSGILGAIFFFGSKLYYARRNKSAPLKAAEILRHCEKVLQDVGPELGPEEFEWGTPPDSEEHPTVTH